MNEINYHVVDSLGAQAFALAATPVNHGSQAFPTFIANLVSGNDVVVDILSGTDPSPYSYNVYFIIEKLA